MNRNGAFAGAAIGGALGGLMLGGLATVSGGTLAAIEHGALLTGSSVLALLVVAAIGGGLIGSILCGIVLIPMSGLEPFAPRLRAVLPWFAGATIVGGVSGFYHLPKASFLYGLPSIAGFRELTGLSSILWGSAVPVRTVLSCFVGALIGALMGMGAYIAMNARTFGNALPWLLWSVAGGFCAAGVGELTFGIIFNTFGEDIASLRVQAFSFLYAGVPGAWAVFLIVFSWWLARGTGSRRVLAATLVATIVGLGLFGVLALETTSRLVTTLAPEQKVPAFVVLENFEGKRYPADLAPAPDGIRSGEKLNIQLNFLYQAFPDPALLMLTTVLAVCVCTWFMVFWSARNPSPDRGSA